MAETSPGPAIQTPSAWRYKDTLFFVLGGLLLFVGIIGVAAELLAEPSPNIRL